MLASISELETKAFAKRLAGHLAAKGISIKHSQALEAVAAMLGFRDYNTLRASLPVSDGAVVESVGPQNNRAPIKDRFGSLGEFLYSALWHNHEVARGKNPNAICLAAFNEEQIEHLTDQAVYVLEKLGKKISVINAARKTSLAFYNEIAGTDFRATYEASEAVVEMLYREDRVFLIKEFSKLEDNHKASHMRSLIKVIDDAHIKGVHPKGDLVFVDYASFFEKSFRTIGNYVWIRAITNPWDIDHLELLVDREKIKIKM